MRPPWTRYESPLTGSAASTPTCPPTSSLSRDGLGSAALRRSNAAASTWRSIASSYISPDAWLCSLDASNTTPAGPEATRRAALSLGDEAGHLGVQGWAYEMKAWFALTRGDYRGVIAASDAGIAAAPHESVAVQLYAQKAKAWARLGDRQQTEVALDKGRDLLESLPYPDNIEDHFVVDPAKYDFYRMDAYRRVGEDRLAEQLASEVIRASTDFDGTERAPMRIAEVRVTLGVVAARGGDLESALAYGEQALRGDRQSRPSLAMVSSDLGQVFHERYEGDAQATAFLDHIRDLRKER